MAGRCQAEVWANIARVLESGRVIDGGQERQGGNRPHARHRHQAFQRGLVAGQRTDLAVQRSDLHGDMAAHLGQLGD